MSRLLLLITVVLMFGLTACSSPPPIPDDHFYRFGSLAAVESADEKLTQGGLYVAAPRAAGVRRSRSMLYTEDANNVALKRYNYHMWEEAPTNLLHKRLLEYLEQAQLAGSVSSRPQPGLRLRLESDIEKFERRINLGEVAAVVRIRFALVDKGDVLFEQTYEKAQPAADDSMSETVVAFTEAVDGIIALAVNEMQLSTQGQDL